MVWVITQETITQVCQKCLNLASELIWEKEGSLLSKEQWLIQALTQ
jgi:hypothetical protein